MSYLYTRRSAQHQAADARTWVALILTWLCIAGLPFGRSVELPNIIMAIWAVALIARRGTDFLWRGQARRFSILFLVFWLPMATSLVGAVDIRGSLETVLLYPRFYFSGLFVVAMLARADAQEQLLRGLAWLLAFWIADALLQALLGYDILGFAYFPGRLNGIFGDHHFRLGVVLGPLAALLLVYVTRLRRFSLAVLALAVSVIAVLLAGSRAGWIMLAVVLLGLFVANWRDTRRLAWRSLLVLSVVLLVLLPVAFFKIDGFAQRVQQTALIFHGGRHSVDEAVSWRLPIWATSLRMIRHHPVFGVGVRGYRYAYPEYALPGDVFVTANGKRGANYAHQELLETASEAGLIGLAGFVSFLTGLLWIWRQADSRRRRAMLPYGLALLAALFPLNTHMAVYSSFWGQLIWWMVALYCSVAETEDLPAAST